MRTKLELWIGVTATTTAALLACGGSVSSEGAGKTDAGASADGGVESASGQDAAPSDADTHRDGTTQDAGAKDAASDQQSSADGGVCPAAPPTPGAPCTTANLLCEYGASWVAECDVVATCVQSGGSRTWSLEYDGGSGCYVTAGGSACPASLAAAQGHGCSQGGTYCEYPDGWCECEISCGGPPPPPDAGTTWLCSTPPATGCPTTRPRFGSPCANEPAFCDYGLCCGGSNMECQDGSWQGSILLGGCP